jgi:hypothetical protein
MVFDEKVPIVASRTTLLIRRYIDVRSLKTVFHNLLLQLIPFSVRPNHLCLLPKYNASLRDFPDYRLFTVTEISFVFWYPASDLAVTRIV